MLTINEQEFEDIHIMRRSIYPLLIRLILIYLIIIFAELFLNYFFSILFRNSSTAAFALAISFILFLILIFLGFISIYVTLKWASDVYIIKFPQVIIRSGVFVTEEKNLTANKTTRVKITQGILGKIFNYGNICFEEALGIEKDVELIEVSNPHHLINIFKEEKSE